jgi:hypothetical protein
MLAAIASFLPVTCVAAISISPPSDATYGQFSLNTSADCDLLCFRMPIMTHPNPQVADWLRVLNWRDQRQSARIRVLMPQIHGPHHTGNAVFRPKDADRLRLLVDAWMNADRDWRKLALPLRRKDAEQLDRQMKKSMRGYFSVDDDGRLITWIDDTTMLPFDVAVAFFLRIASDAEAWRLCGPCSNCKMYFARERKRKRSKKYCSKCRSSESGPRMEKLRERVRNNNLYLVRNGQKEYRRHRRREDWKTWVVNYVNGRSETPINPKSLTRWVNSRLIDDLSLTTRHS